VKYGKPLNFPDSSSPPPSPTTPLVSRPIHPKVRTKDETSDSPPLLSGTESQRAASKATAADPPGDPATPFLTPWEMELWRDECMGSMTKAFESIALALDTVQSHVPYELDGSTELQTFLEGSMAKRGISRVQNLELAVSVLVDFTAAPV
jgi:hypothetical protein